MKDIWFCKDSRGNLWVAQAEPGQEPHNFPTRISSISGFYKTFSKSGMKIAQVGIIDPRMVGLR